MTVWRIPFGVEWNPPTRRKGGKSSSDKSHHFNERHFHRIAENCRHQTCLCRALSVCASARRRIALDQCSAGTIA